MTKGIVADYIDYVEKSFEEISKRNISHVVKQDLVIGAAFREILVKLLILLKHKKTLKSAELEGIL